MKINKKIIIIIGSEGLIGSNLSKYLIDNHSNRYNIINVDISKKNNDQKNYYQADITIENSIKKLIKKIHSKYKKIDVVINCAYPRNKNWAKSFIDSSESDLKQNLFNQLGSAILICRNFYKYFEIQGFGNIILLSSIQSIKAPSFDHYKDTNIKSPIEYSAIKSGIISIIKYMAKFSKNKNIRFNAISPGGIYANQPKSFLRRYKKDCINKGMLNPEDLVSAFLFLIDDGSKFINGQNIIVDDGWSL